jgi:hypothetical protein
MSQEEIYKYLKENPDNWFSTQDIVKKCLCKRSATSVALLKMCNPGTGCLEFRRVYVWRVNYGCWVHEYKIKEEK